MCDQDSQCITRVVDGSGHDLQLAQLQAVMQRIQSALLTVPIAERTYLGNALLNLAVNRILCDEGVPRTASILMRMSDAVQANPVPPDASRAVDLSVLHG